MEFIHFAIAKGVTQIEVVTFVNEQEESELHTLMAQQYPHIKMV
ncbi:hypothetical protein [Pseudoalteromonas rubra]|nr:hypothetical protein [Pseudoalteromonas rubra]